MQCKEMLLNYYQKKSRITAKKKRNAIKSIFMKLHKLHEVRHYFKIINLFFFLFNLL